MDGSGTAQIPIDDPRGEVATLAAGCFWGVEARLRAIPGVIDAEVGYAGGDVDAVTYEQVCSGTTGHAEVARVVFDPSVVSYEALLDAFFAMHDPTTRNRQGPDVGTQYRSAIMPHSPVQEAAARERIAAWNERLGGRVVTTVEPTDVLWRAEEYHQRYSCPAST